MLQTDDILEEELLKQLKEWKDKHSIQLFPMRNKNYGGVSANGVASYVSHSRNQTVDVI